MCKLNQRFLCFVSVCSFACGLAALPPSLAVAQDKAAAKNDPVKNNAPKNEGPKNDAPPVTQRRLDGADKYMTQGAYTDGDGIRHAWTVNTSHVLIWDDKPFVPVGGRFQAKSWTPKPTDEDFAADKEALAALKRAGLTDIYVQPSKGGLTGVPVAAIQQLMSHLDSEGFTYGVSINDGPDAELLAYDVRPGRYRQVLPEGAKTARFPVENALSALFFVVAETGDDIIEASEATMVSEGARIAPRPRPAPAIALLFPRRVYFASGPLGLPNLWDGFDGYRDTLLATLRQLKYGKGFRFFVDALPATLKISTESNTLVPTGAGFQTEWATWLAKRYKNMDNVEQSWRMTDRGLQEFREIARLLPLWYDNKGVQYLYDAADEHRYKVDATHSQFWRDLNEFKADSVRNYMNELAQILKKNVANVPIVYRSGGYSPLFNDIPNVRGFDGIGMSAYGRGSDLANLYAGNVYGQAAEATKTLWLPVIATADAAPGEKTAPGYASRVALHGDLDRLRDIGARGFYVDGVRLTDPKLAMFDLSQSDEQLSWLAEYGKMVTASNIGVADAPEALFFPRGIQYASVKQLADGAWWVPTARPSVEYDFGVCGKAYSMADDNGGIVYYLWNPTGRRQIHVRLPKAAKAPNMPPIEWSHRAEGSVRGGFLTLTIGPDPVRLTNFPFPVVPIPTEAYDENVAEAKRLVAALRKRNHIDSGYYEMTIEGATKRLNEDNPMRSLKEILDLKYKVRGLLQPYAWLEAEEAANHSFDQARDQVGASGGRVLVTEKRPQGSAAPVALYKVTVRTDGRYNIWVAASPGSQLNFRLDEQTLLDDPTAAQPVGAPFADGALVWINIGKATIPKGSHVLEMRADGPATVDAILLIQGDFTPNGITPPPVKP